MDDVLANYTIFNVLVQYMCTGSIHVYWFNTYETFQAAARFVKQARFAESGIGTIDIFDSTSEHIK